MLQILLLSSPSLSHSHINIERFNQLKRFLNEKNSVNGLASLCKRYQHLIQKNVKNKIVMAKVATMLFSPHEAQKTMIKTC